MGSIIDAAQPTMWTIDLKWLGLTFDIHPELQQNYGMLLVKNDIFTIYGKLKIFYFPFWNLSITSTCYVTSQGLDTL